LQIAATLDKGQPGKNDGKHMFWSITLTYLLSVSFILAAGGVRTKDGVSARLADVSR
jgi:hypothetical protein